MSLQAVLQDSVATAFDAIDDLARTGTIKSHTGGTRVNGVYTPTYDSQACKVVPGVFKKGEESGAIQPGDVKLLIKAKGLTTAPKPNDIVVFDSNEYTLGNVWQVPRTGKASIWIGWVREGSA